MPTLCRLVINTEQGAENFFDNSDFTQQFASTNFWDTLDDSSTSSFVNSAAASVSLHTPSTAANSPASHASAELPAKPRYQSHKHSIPGKSGPKKRRCSEESKSRVIQDPSALDCSDYWLRFDSDNESLDQFLDYNSQDTKNVGLLCSASTCNGGKGTDARFSLNAAESFADIQVRSLSLSRPLSSKTSTVGTTGDTNKVALPPVTSELIDDSALEQALSDEDDLFSMALAHELGKATTTAPPPPPEAQERLYSTPLSWEPPRPGYHMNYMNTTTMSISDAERQRLLAVALGTGQAPTQQTSRPPAVADFHFEMTQSPSDSKSNTPEPKPRNAAARPPPSRKNSSETGEKPKEKPKNSERAAHNDIERKYRTNLKDKIAELRDAIPSLRAIPEDEDPNSPTGSSRTAPKVSKVSLWHHQPPTHAYANRFIRVQSSPRRPNISIS